MLCALWVKVRRKLGAKDVKRCVRVCVCIYRQLFGKCEGLACVFSGDADKEFLL